MIDAADIREGGFLKYYRHVRKWACAQYGLKDADLELLMFLEHEGRFTRKKFQDGAYIYCWDRKRWERLRKDGWIDVWREGDRRASKGSIFKTSFKCSHMIARIYRILWGEEDVPTSIRNVYARNKTYTDKVMNKALDDMVKDKDR